MLLLVEKERWIGLRFVGERIVEKRRFWFVFPRPHAPPLFPLRLTLIGSHLISFTALKWSSSQTPFTPTPPSQAFKTLRLTDARGSNTDTDDYRPMDGDEVLPIRLGCRLPVDPYLWPAVLHVTGFLKSQFPTFSPTRHGFIQTSNLRVLLNPNAKSIKPIAGDSPDPRLVRV